MLIFALILFTLAFLPRAAFRMAVAARCATVPCRVSDSQRSQGHSFPASAARTQRFACSPFPVSRQPLPDSIAAHHTPLIPRRGPRFQSGLATSFLVFQRFSAKQPLSAGATCAVRSGHFRLFSARLAALPSAVSRPPLAVCQDVMFRSTYRTKPSFGGIQKNQVNRLTICNTVSPHIPTEYATIIDICGGERLRTL